jgi:pimeloyl-ACP methyl ester carboxylesterase
MTAARSQQKSADLALLGRLRGPLRGVSRISPRLGAVAVERLFFVPPRPRRSRGEATLRTARRFRVPSDGRMVTAWRWGQGPTVVLLHGWGGRAAQLTGLVPALVEKGLAVVALDAPGHGDSGRGRSSAPEFARALAAVADGTPTLHGVIAHSFGAVATMLAMRDGLRVSRVTLLAPARDPPDWFGELAERLDLLPSVVNLLRRRFERRVRIRWDDLNLRPSLPGFACPVLVVHDHDDPEVGVETARAIAAAWPGAELHLTRGLGHNRLLRDAATVARVADFMAGEGDWIADRLRPASEVR